MKKLTIIILAFVFCSFYGQKDYNGLIGTYDSRDNRFEFYSIMILQKDNRFVYKYGVGGCQGEVTGNWIVENKKLKFTNDNEFLNNETTFYPNLGLLYWTVKKFGIKPDEKVDNCFFETEVLHSKR